MDELTTQTETEVIEREREIHVLQAYGAQIKTDGNKVWAKDVDGGVPIDQFRAAVEAIIAGVESVEFHDVDASLERDDDKYDEGDAACVFSIGGQTRYTSAKEDGWADLTDLLDAAE